jgi:transcriptional regulator GlxA family with amidase domain
VTGDLRRVSVVLFEGFELPDVFGPAELVSLVPGRLAIEFTGPGAGPVASSQGGQVTATTGYDAAAAPDIMLIPGGQGTRGLVTGEAFLSWLRAWATPASVVTSVCTGSAVLAAAGLLDGYRAASNKAAFAWVREQSGKVGWIAQARWAGDRDRWTSSGVAAGMDMAAALLADLFGKDVAQRATTRAELEVHEDASWDPLAKTYGLTGAAWACPPSHLHMNYIPPPSGYVHSESCS